ncbi:guanine-N(7)-methyltransferase [Trichocladium antarcticum]|uniref:mRNA cap guanine-N(7) methyltransferase n=1 Tax=Trichocladium antarcticum TaxID=1450529 RepID=A0AAN6ULF4_9PEZI|nr:guanine-N(7)-methyltransferase [Trichocladium antarcticum]
MSSRHRKPENDHEEFPQPFDAKKLAPAKKRQRSNSPTASANASASGEPPRKLKRPGQRARITDAEREVIRQRALEREKQAQQQTAAAEQHGRSAINDVVRAHYNAVPERGREWRKTDSQIKGLRSFNNWVKSCIVQKFSPDEDHSPGAMERGFSSGNRLLVLDIGCGKGGDLFKWQQAPQPVDLYVGLDPAEVSIDQARERYRSMSNRGGGGRGGRGGYQRRPQPRIFDARFHVKDCFGETIEDLDIVRQVGFTADKVSSSRGFDVVSMMFCMHYAFESEHKARQMLKNVAGSLKKGGRFIGCIPNSDVISAKVLAFNEQRDKKKAKAAAAEATKTQPPDASATPASPESPSKEDGELEEGEAEEDDEDDDADQTVNWKNSIYRVRFPGPTPADGVFRPPFGWKYNFFLSEAVEEVPEYVVPWEAFRALAEDYNLELQYHKPFDEVWETEKDDRELGPLSERMGVRDRNTGKLTVSKEEMEAASFYVAFCFYRV